MNIKTKISLLTLLCGSLLLSSCSQTEPPRQLTAQEKKEDIVDHHCLKVGRQLAKKHKLFFNGASGSIHPAIGYNPQKISFEYQVFRSFTQEEARILVADCVETIQREFNHNPAMEGNIPRKGYDVEDMILDIFVEPGQKTAYHPKIAVISLFHGKIKYKTYDPDKNYPSTKSLVTETWEEAKDLLNE